MPVSSAEQYPTSPQVHSWRHTQQRRKHGPENTSAFITDQRPPRPGSSPGKQRTVKGLVG